MLVPMLIQRNKNALNFWMIIVRKISFMLALITKGRTSSDSDGRRFSGQAIPSPGHIIFQNTGWSDIYQKKPLILRSSRALWKDLGVCVLNLQPQRMSDRIASMYWCLVWLPILDYIAGQRIFGGLLLRDEEGLNGIKATKQSGAPSCSSGDCLGRNLFLCSYPPEWIMLTSTGTGEHGDGLEYLEEDLGEDTVQLMKTVKAIDPLNIMNPGKVCMGLSSIFVRKLYPDKDNVEC